MSTTHLVYRPINTIEGDKIMAKIIEANTVLTISQLVKTNDSNETITLPEDFTTTVVELITQLLGDQYVVELTDLQ